MTTSPHLSEQPGTDPHRPGRALPRDDGARTERQCGRCRRYFDGPEGAGTHQEWWLCPPCHLALFGPSE